MTRRRLVLAILLLFTVALGSPTPQRGPLRLRIIPQHPSIPIGAKRTFFIERTNLRGNPKGFLMPAAQWNSSLPAVASFDSPGVLTAKSVGTTVVTGISGPYHDFTVVTVTPVAMIAIQVTPANSSLGNGLTQQFTAKGINSDGSMLDVTASAAWSSSKPAVASIAASGGLATAASIGSTVIGASLSGIKGSTGLNVGLNSIAVTPANATIAQGELQPFTAIGTFSDASKHNVSSTVNWSSNPQTVATINSQGVASGISAGTTTIQAASQAATAGTAQLTVNAVPKLVTVKVLPNAPSIGLGGSQQFTALGIFSDKSKKVLTAVSWFTSDPSVAQIDATGNATTLATGTATISAIAAAGNGFVSGSTLLTVNPPPTLISITLAPLTATLRAQTSQQFTATGHYSDSTTKIITDSVNWSSSNTRVAIIGPTGLTGNVGVGTTTISATLSGVTGTATLNIGGVPQFLYLNNSDSTISSFVINSATGGLRPNGYAVQSAPPYRSTVDPTNRFYYVSSYQSHQVFMYTINPANGVMTPTSPPSITTQGTQPLVVAVEPSGRFAYVAGQVSPFIEGYSIDQTTGVLSPLATPTFPAGPDSISIDIDPSGKFLYISDFTGSVYGYAINAGNGNLTAVAGSPFAAGSGPSSVKVHPSGQYLYVTDQNSSQVTSLTINPVTGALSPLGAAVATGAAPFASAMDPLGRFFYTANISAGGISGFKIAGNGTLLAATGSPFSPGISPSDLRIDPTGQFLYCASSNDNKLSIYSIDPTQGTLTLVDTFRSRGPFSMAMANGALPLFFKPRFLYTPNRDAGTVSGFNIDPQSGFLESTSPPTFAASGFTDSMQADPQGRFVFVTNPDFGINTIGSYAVDPFTGSLTPTNPSTQPAGSDPETNNLAIDPSGRFIFSPSFNDNDVWAYAIDQSSGVLTTIIPGTVATGVRPEGAKVDPTGRFLYVPNTVSNNVSGYNIDPTSGMLTPMAPPTFAAGTQPAKITIDPRGKFAYAANEADKTISGYTIDAISGALSPTVPPTFAAGTSVFYVAVDPAGKYLYATNSGDSVIAVYAIDPASGALTPTNPATFPSGSNPNSVEIDPSGQFAYAANYSASTISAYSVDPVAGTLTPVAGSPFPTGPGPKQITMIGALTAPTPTLLFVTVGPSGVTLAQGVQQQFSAVGTFSDGSTQDLTASAAWTSSDATVGTVNSSGLALGVGQGTAVITASVQGFSGSTSMDVSGLSLTSLTVTPPVSTVPQNSSLQYQAVGGFSDGTSQDLTSSVIWSCSNAAAASITGGGLATALMPSGPQVTITATSGVLTANAALNLHAPDVLQTITITPANNAIALGTSVQFTATGNYSVSPPQDLTTSVVWASGTPATATIDSSGLAASVAPGATQVTATLGSVVGSTTLTVNQHTLISIAIQPQSAFLPLQHTLQFKATGTYSDGSTTDITTTVNWTSANSGVVSIGPNTGLATGKGLGTVNISAKLTGVTNSASVTGIF